MPPGDVPALVDGVERLLADEPARVAMGAAARERAERHYAWPDIAARLEGIYDRWSAASESRSARAA